jgi:putative sterol carrier protein
MATDLFSAAGTAHWQQLLNHSSRFAEAAADWSGSLLLVEESPGEASRQSWVVIGGGKCLEARVGTPADADAADFVLTATSRTWQQLVTAQTTPAMAALTGKLKLTKGEVFALIPHAKAAAELLAAAAGGPEGLR